MCDRSNGRNMMTKKRSRETTGKATTMMKMKKKGAPSDLQQDYCEIMDNALMAVRASCSMKRK